MTHYQSALTALIGEVLAGPELAHQEVFPRMLQAGVQDLVDAEATVKIGADRYERFPERTTRRNGTRPKTLATPAGEVDLQIPKLREGSFLLSLLHPRRRVDTALATGVSGDGRRGILGMALGDAETTDFWTEFLRFSATGARGSPPTLTRSA